MREVDPVLRGCLTSVIARSEATKQSQNVRLLLKFRYQELPLGSAGPPRVLALITPSPRRGRDSGGAEERGGGGEKETKRRMQCSPSPLLPCSPSPPRLFRGKVRMGGRGRALSPPHLNPPPRRGEEMKSAMAPV